LGGAAILLLLLVAVIWIWHTAQAGLDILEAEVGAAVNADLWTEIHAPADVQVLDLGGDVAVVQVAVPATEGQPAYRETRVYQRANTGWVRTAPSAATWGPRRRLETSHFVFHHYDLDEAVVEVAATKLDALYPSLYAAFSPEAPRGNQRVVQVDPAQAPGQVTERPPGQDPFVVASPAAYRAPVTISQADLLAQSVLLVLLDDLVAQAGRRHVPLFDVRRSVEGVRLANLLNGVRLWQLWATDLPLAAWRKPVVQWVYSNVPAPMDRAGLVPAFLPDLCSRHRLWLSSPLQLQIPLNCYSPEQQEQYLAWRFFHPPPTQLAQLAAPSAADAAPGLQSVMGEAGRSSHPAVAVALATVMEYAAAVYGTERIPLLVATLHQHERAETLIQAVFGVSLAEFESGWQMYLAEQYGISIDH
jgi:hypothetical protein